MDTDQLRTWSAISNAPASYYVNASDEERKIMRDWLRGLLLEREVVVEFNRHDNQHRRMRCTLSEDHGARFVNKESTLTEHRPDVCVVWDCEANAWRSFRWDRLKKIEFTLG